MQLYELLFRRIVLFGSHNCLCVCSSPYRENRKAQLLLKAKYQKRWQTIWLSIFPYHKWWGKEQKEAQGPNSIQKKRNAKE